MTYMSCPVLQVFEVTYANFPTVYLVHCKIHDLFYILILARSQKISRFQANFEQNKAAIAKVWIASCY
jgi:ribosomal protein S26